VGSSVTVIDEAELAARQDQSVAEVLRSVPGVAVARTGPGGALTQVRLRGAEANHTLVLIDGVEANDPTAEAGFDFAHLVASGIQRIEILRGPQSALWGSDALGGVVNIITRRGGGAPSGSVAAEGGSHHSWGLRGNVGAGADGYDIYLFANHRHTGGVSASPIGTEDDGYENTTVSLKGGLYPREDLDLNLVARYTRAESETDPQDFTFESPTYGLIVDADNLTEVERFYGRAEASYRLLDGAWEHTLGTALTDTENRFFDEGTRVNRSQGRKFKLDYQSAYFLDTADAAHTFIVAAEREKESFEQEGEGPDAPENQDRDIVNYGVVGEYRLALFDNVDLGAALRYDDNARFDDAVTYRLTGSYRFTDTGTRLHASLGRGVKNPTFTELFGFFPDNFIGNPDLQPETSVGLDVGVEQVFWDGRALLDITYFRADLEDEIVTTFDNETFLSSVVNGEDDSQRQGVELSLQLNPRPDLDIRASYTYIDSDDPDGEHEVRRPRHGASLALTYRFLDDRADVNLTVDYQGEREDLDFAAFPAQRVDLDSYTLVDLAASYRIAPRFRVFARVQNLLDEDYQEVLGYQTLDRTFYLGLEGSF